MQGGEAPLPRCVSTNGFRPAFSEVSKPVRYEHAILPIAARHDCAQLFPFVKGSCFTRSSRGFATRNLVGEKEKRGGLAALLLLGFTLEIMLIPAFRAVTAIVTQLFKWEAFFANRATWTPWTDVLCASSIFAMKAPFILRLLFFELVMHDPSGELMEAFQELVHRAPSAVESEEGNSVFFGHH